MVRQDDALTVVLRVELLFDIWEMNCAIVLRANMVSVFAFVHLTIPCIHLHRKTVFIIKECPVAEAIMSGLSLIIWLDNVLQI